MRTFEGVIRAFDPKTKSIALESASGTAAPLVLPPFVFGGTFESGGVIVIPAKGQRVMALQTDTGNLYLLSSFIKSSQTGYSIPIPDTAQEGDIFIVTPKSLISVRSEGAVRLQAGPPQDVLSLFTLETANNIGSINMAAEEFQAVLGNVQMRIVNRATNEYTLAFNLQVSPTFNLSFETDPATSTIRISAPRGTIEIAPDRIKLTHDMVTINLEDDVKIQNSQSEITISASQITLHAPTIQITSDNINISGNVRLTSEHTEISSSITNIKGELMNIEQSNIDVRSTHFNLKSGTSYFATTLQLKGNATINGELQANKIYQNGAAVATVPAVQRAVDKLFESDKRIINLFNTHTHGTIVGPTLTPAPLITPPALAPKIAG